MRQKVHANACEIQVKETEHTERPGKRQQQIDQREGIQCHRIPLSQEGQPAVVQGVPERKLATPKALAMVIRQRIAEDCEVAMKKSPPADDHLGIRGENQRREQRREAPWREPFIRCLGNARLSSLPKHGARLWQILTRNQCQILCAPILNRADSRKERGRPRPRVPNAVGENSRTRASAPLISRFLNPPCHFETHQGPAFRLTAWRHDRPAWVL